ncbi:MAG TPA: hypothetical protein DG761_08215 [Gammaproteobacteria bacterium]|jgi:uncharacterized membrane protein|nr:NnrU family protein [Arenicellales bacterium]MDP6792032.1 NnrU family protein [Arenicellales bacterium]MDP6917638.1 NnrU family protein [Arenicellales bacterium]HCX87997.1 hypothetical protein [Gammaproteobacteria bacterium]|tara:strand:- start:1947 stop:2504 length:558 start_codon:yes stop_codon:yes gene_type:complete
MSDAALLITGIALWYAAHLFKRIAPGARKAMGGAGKGIVALALVISIILMVFGYRGIDTAYLWHPPSWLIPVNNVLVLIALFMLSPAARKGALLTRLRHPMLIGVLLWAVAHLMINGELAAVILFGGLGLWPLVEIVVINHAEPDWQPGTKGALAKDGLFFLASVVLLGIIGYVHGLIGPPVFGV